MSRLRITFGTALILALSTAAPARAASISLTFFPSSMYNANTAVMDGALGITGYTIDTFEQTSLLPGLTVTLSGGVPVTTWSALPNLLDESSCGGLSAAAWDGTHYASNLTTNQLSNCNSPANIASSITFDYAPGTTSFAVGLSNFQSPNSPQFPITNHELFVNGVDMGVLETLAGANWSPGIMRNAFLRIDITGGSINSVGFSNLTSSDFLVFDHLAVAPASTTPPVVPEPASLVLMGTGLALASKRFGRRRP